MKHCPNCERPFSDRLAYCIPDGSPLLNGPPPLRQPPTEMAATEKIEQPFDDQPNEPAIPRSALHIAMHRRSEADEGNAGVAVRPTPPGGGVVRLRRRGAGLIGIALLSVVIVVVSTASVLRGLLAGAAQAPPVRAGAVPAPADETAPRLSDVVIELTGPSWVELTKDGQLVFAGPRDRGDEVAITDQRHVLRLSDAGQALIRSADGRSRPAGPSGAAVVLTFRDGEAFGAVSAVAPPSRFAAASLHSTSLEGVHGTATFREKDGAVVATLEVSGLPPHAARGLSIGVERSCDPGPLPARHLDPHGRRHGLPDDSMRHLGDLGNVRADSVGRATLSMRIAEASLDRGPTGIVDRVLQLHDWEDDGRTDPDGGAGARSACGIIEMRD